MRIIAFLTDYAVVGRVIDLINLTFIAERPPPPQFAYQEVPIAAFIIPHDEVRQNGRSRDRSASAARNVIIIL